MQSLMSNPFLDIQNVYDFECSAEYWSHSSIFKINVFDAVPNVEHIHSSVFIVCMVLNAELNIDPTVRYSK